MEQFKRALKEASERIEEVRERMEELAESLDSLDQEGAKARLRGLLRELD